MSIAERFRGTAELEISGAFPEGLLNAAAVNAIELWDVESIDAYTLRAKTYEAAVPELESIAARTMCDLRVVSLRGGSRDRALLKRRRALALLLIITALALFLSSLFVWEIRIQGNGELSSAEILRALSECDVYEGCYWPDIDVETVRCKMLLKLPKLAWMTVNVHGSCADVLITERAEKPEIYKESDAADIIAARTGIIDSMTVRNGKAAVTVGQAVTKGETLISQTLDSITNAPRAVRADGSVKARTWYELSAVLPAEREEKGESRLKALRFAIKTGKKRVNFYFGSRKTLDGCDKIIHDKKLGVEGLFAMPLSLIVEEYRESEKTISDFADTASVEDALAAALTDSIDGEIVSQRFVCSCRSGAVVITLYAECLEEIGTVLREK